MARRFSQHRHRLVLPLVLASLGWTAAPAMAGANETPGNKGAQIYCFMRSGGNSHQVSWDAAYAVIKRQSGSWFKPSPEHASVMITEAVVQNPTAYPDCSKYMGALFEKPVEPTTAPKSEKTGASQQSASSGTSRTERYAY